MDPYNYQYKQYFQTNHTNFNQPTFSSTANTSNTNLQDPSSFNQTNVTNQTINLEEDRKKTDAILNGCISIRKDAILNYEKTKIQEAIEILNDEKRRLIKLQNFIENKATHLRDYLQYIIKTINENNKLLSQYNLSIYTKTPQIFSYKPKDKNKSTIQYINSYISENPFITFNDIYDPTEEKNLKKFMTETYRKAIISKNKTLLLYGPKGCGKSLTAMAIANHIKAKFIQIDDLKFFIEDNKFAFELSNLSVARQPIIVYLKYIDAMYPALKFIYFFLDKIINGKTDNKILIIASCICKPEQLPKELYQYFIYLFYIGPFLLKFKKGYIEFICQKLGITLTMSNENWIRLCQETFADYSNEDIMKVIIDAKESKERDERYLGGNVLTYEDLTNRSKLIVPSITKDVASFYQI